MEKKTLNLIIAICTVVSGVIALVVNCYVQHQILEQAQAQTILINQKILELTNPYRVTDEKEPN